MDSDPPRLRSIGGGVYWSEAGGDPTKLISGQRFFRFMDELYLPAPTDALAPEAIVAINRWREEQLKKGVFPHTKLVQDLAKAAFHAAGNGNLLELGCGCFPLALEFDVSDFYGLDIDPVAAEFGRARGLAVSSDLPDSVTACRFDFLAALFMMQFAISEAEFNLIQSLSERGVVFANVPTKDLSLRASRLSFFEALPNCSIFEIASSEVHDVIVIASGELAKDRFERAVSSVSAALNVE